MKFRPMKLQVVDDQNLFAGIPPQAIIIVKLEIESGACVAERFALNVGDHTTSWRLHTGATHPLNPQGSNCETNCVLL